jgi:putative ABC transport system permease protein
VLVWESAPFFGLRDSPVAPANYYDWKSRSRSFEEIGALEFHAYRLTADGSPEIAEGALITPEVLRALRVRPMLGRSFRDDDNRHGAAKVALISEGFWRRRFNSDTAVVGRSVLLNGEQHEIVGVLAAGSEPPAQYSSKLGEIWTPLESSYTAQRLAERGRHNWMVIARLRPGIALEQADAEMAAIGARLAAEYPDTNRQVGAFVAPLREHFVTSRRQVLGILFATVAVVLLIACSNLANLLLCRAANRTKEVAVRAALGAGTWQIGRQFFCESLLISSAGAGLGLLLATSTFQFLAHLAPATVTGLNALDIDWRVLLFTLSIAVVTTVAFSFVPILQIRRLDLIEPLKRSARSLAAGSGSPRMRAVLICTEVALAFLLLISAGLLIQTFAKLRGVEVGYRTENMLTLSIPAPTSRRGVEKSVAFQTEVLRRITALPGVASAGFTNHIPLVVKGDINGIGAEGRDLSERLQCRSRVAGLGYLRTMGIPVLRGRDVDERDAKGVERVALINQRLAHLLWPDQNALGRRIHLHADVWARVIGIVGDIHQSGLDVAPSPEYYTSSLQSEYPPTSLAIHTSSASGDAGLNKL